MDNPVQTDAAPPDDPQLNVAPTVTGQHIELPPSQSLTSVVLNSIGNGGTIGSIPLLVAETHAAFTHTHLSNKWLLANLGLIGVTSGIGCYFGLQEAKEIKTYRQSLNDEINKMHDETAQNASKIQALTEALQAREQAQKPYQTR